MTTLRAGASDPEGTTAPALAIGKLCELATRLSNGELNVQPFYQSLGALNLFVSTQLAGVRYEEAVRATIPFIVIMMIDLAIMAVFPVIPLMLPHLLFGYPLPR